MTAVAVYHDSIPAAREVEDKAIIFFIDREGRGKLYQANHESRAWDLLKEPPPETADDVIARISGMPWLNSDQITHQLLSEILVELRKLNAPKP